MYLKALSAKGFSEYPQELVRRKKESKFRQKFDINRKVKRKDLIITSLSIFQSSQSKVSAYLKKVFLHHLTSISAVHRVVYKIKAAKELGMPNIKYTNQQKTQSVIWTAGNHFRDSHLNKVIRNCSTEALSRHTISVGTKAVTSVEVPLTRVVTEGRKLTMKRKLRLSSYLTPTHEAPYSNLVPFLVSITLPSDISYSAN